MSDREKQEAFVTLATNDTYSLGCLVLGSSLRRVGTTRQLVVMVTEGVSNPMRTQLAQVFDLLQEVNVLDSNDPVNLGLLGRPDLNVTFTKLHCWRLTQYKKCVFLDADTLVLQNVDELFDREELSAAPDAGWPDCFNSGVYVFQPSQQTYEALLSYATSQGSFDGGDQGLLNMYFNTWATDDIAKHLPFIYNVVSQAFYSYLPAFTQFKDKVKIVHFIGAVKPWHHTYDSTSRKVTPLPGTGHSQEFLQVWWNIFMQCVQPNLDPALTISARTIEPDTKPVSPSEHRAQHFTGETLHVMFPYKPPDVGEVFYSPDTNSNSNNDLENYDSAIHCNSDNCTHEGENIVEMTVIPRPYTGLETHYAEVPLSHINPEEPPLSTYEATRITEGWEAVFRDTGSGSEPKGELEPKEDNEAHSAEAPSSDVGAEGPIETQHYETDSIAEPIDRPPSPKAADEPETISSTSNERSNEVGLVGELASLTIQGASGPSYSEAVSDEQRKINWERGQIDYLGQDSFENIQKKIDATLSSETASAPVNTSPFAPAPSKKEATSQPEPKPEVIQASEPSKSESVAPVTTDASASEPSVVEETVTLALAPETSSEPEPVDAEAHVEASVSLDLSLDEAPASEPALAPESTSTVEAASESVPEPPAPEQAPKLEAITAPASVPAITAPEPVKAIEPAPPSGKAPVPQPKPSQLKTPAPAPKPALSKPQVTDPKPSVASKPAVTPSKPEPATPPTPEPKPQVSKKPVDPPAPKPSQLKTGFGAASKLTSPTSTQPKPGQPSPVASKLAPALQPKPTGASPTSPGAPATSPKPGTAAQSNPFAQLRSVGAKPGPGTAPKPTSPSTAGSTGATSAFPGLRPVGSRPAPGGRTFPPPKK